MRRPLVLLMLLCLAGALPVYASQATGHVYIALKARESAPPAVRTIIDANLDAYLAGATGPDIALTSYLLAEALGFEHPGSEAHYQKTGQLVMNLLKLAGELPDEAARNQGLAFGFGWLTHYCADCAIHPLVNEFGGYFGAGGERIVRHKTLELVECEHVFQKKLGEMDNYVVKSGPVPTDLICSAFHATFPEKGIYAPPIQATDLSFVADLDKSSGIMALCTQWMVNIHTQAGSWTGPVFSTALKGTPPTPDEYKAIMDPLIIDSVELEEPDRAAGETKGYLKVNYTLWDVKLHKLFCRQWDARIGGAIALAGNLLGQWAVDPAAFGLADRNLDTGGAIGSHYDTAQEWPGNPEIRSLLVFAAVKNPKQEDVSPDWGQDGQWAPIPFMVEGLGGADQVVGTIETLTGWNGGKAGRAFLKIPIDCTEAGEYTGKVRLLLARQPDKKPYGWEDQGHIIEAKWEGSTAGEAELSVLFLVDTSGSMDGAKIEAARAAVKASVDQTNDKKTEWCLARFGGCSVGVVCRFTMDPEKLKAAADTLSASGDTPYTYGREKALKYLVQRGRGKTGRLVILCDGQDNCPEHGGITQPEAAAALRKLMQVVQPAAPAGNRGGNGP